MPYDAKSVERISGDQPAKLKPSDRRSEFARDRDRVIYSSAFRRLAGKTQVVAADEDGLYHTRLTHTMKVAQLGRRMAERLREKNLRRHGPPKRGLVPGPDPDLVEAACLAHDLGHPPFGHVGEESLCEGFDGFAAGDAIKRGGFEGNAQTFRMISFLAARVPQSPRADVDVTRDRFGLDLTRATLDATVKYPRLRVQDPDKRKWGAYDLDEETLRWVRTDSPPRATATPCFEAELMDWCDDVTYAVHDLFDFYRSGHIPLDRLLAAQGSPRRRRVQLSLEAQEFLEVEIPRVRHHWNIDDAKEAWGDLVKMSDVRQPWEPKFSVKATDQAVSSRFITFFMSGITWAGREPCQHEGRLRVDRSREVDRRKRFACSLLKQVLHTKVIGQPSLATQQAGARVIVLTLLKACRNDTRLLPIDRREELDIHKDHLRAATDHVASLTERDAMKLYRRVTGSDLGSFNEHFA